ncbi:MAG TPA: hypothetical protein PLB88_08540 [Thermoanaerobaculaceae bacterium]|nr:hypothetical protein [Thermoanaerobaculaceae bacterium]
MTEDLIRPNETPEATSGLIPSAKDFQRRARRGDFPRDPKDGGPVVIRVGGRVYVSRSRLLAFLEAGGGTPGAYADQYRKTPTATAAGA